MTTENKPESKYDVGVTWRADLVTEYGHIEHMVKGNRQYVERHISNWLPILIDGDSIKITKLKETT